MGFQSCNLKKCPWEIIRVCKFDEFRPRFTFLFWYCHMYGLDLIAIRPFVDFVMVGVCANWNSSATPLSVLEVSCLLKVPCFLVFHLEVICPCEALHLGNMWCFLALPPAQLACRREIPGFIIGLLHHIGHNLQQSSRSPLCTWKIHQSGHSGKKFSELQLHSIDSWFYLDLG